LLKNLGVANLNFTSTTCNCTFPSKPYLSHITVNMRFTLLTFLFALLLSLALAAAPQKAIVVTFEDPNTPQSAVDDAMKAIKDAGGVVTHEYSMCFWSRPLAYRETKTNTTQISSKALQRRHLRRQSKQFTLWETSTFLRLSKTSRSALRTMHE